MSALLPDTIKGFFCNGYCLINAYECGSVVEIAYAEELCRELLAELKEVELSELISIVQMHETQEINSANIPQYSSFRNGTLYMVKMLRMAGDIGPSFLDIGQQILGDNKKSGAYTKYGENHAKLARQYGLVYFKNEGRYRVYLTEFGKLLEKLEESDQEEIINKVSLRIPIIQYCIKNKIFEPDKLIECLEEFLSESTAKRRKSNVEQIVKRIVKSDWK